LIDPPAPFTEREEEQRASFDKIAEGIKLNRGWVDPRDSIISDHMGTIKGVVSDYADGSDLLWDDMFNAALEGAAVAIGNFDPEQGNFKEHLRRSVRNFIRMEMRKIKRWSNEVTFTSLLKESAAGGVEESQDDEEVDMSIENTITSGMWDTRYNSPEEEAIYQEKVTLAKKILGDVVPQLNERENYVLYHVILSDFPATYRKIAEQFHTTKDSILRDVNRLKKLLRKENRNE
jgi:RNA polymerase sigma factor (sigma-70 family)